MTRKVFILFVALSALLSACTLSQPLSGPGYSTDRGIQHSGGNTVFIAITHAVLADGLSNKLRFRELSSAISDSLADQPGFIASSLRTDILGREAWTMTLWQDKESMKAFRRSDVHTAAMKETSNLVKEAYFAETTLPSAQAALTWDDALGLLEQTGRMYFVGRRDRAY